MKLAILLYGMFRHPGTAQYWPLMLPPGDVFVFATFTADPITPRSGDAHVHPNVTFPGILRASRWSIVDQESFDAQIDLDRLVAGVRDPFHAVNKTSLRNAVRTLFQLQSLRRMLPMAGSPYSHAILSRVDLLFVRPVPLAAFQSALVVPNYAQWKGVNDRFAAGPMEQVLRLTDRIGVWRETGALAEKLVKETCRRHNLSVRKMSIGFARRVRVHGILHAPQYPIDAACPMDAAKNIEALRPQDASRCTRVPSPSGGRST